MAPTFGYALRSLLRSPGFTLLALLTIALGTGVNTAVFSIVNAVLLKALPYGEPGRLVRLNEIKGPALYNVSYPNFRDWQQRSSSFERLAIYTAFGLNPVKLPAGSMMVPTGSTSWDLFSVLGVRPILGRGFRAEDDLGDGADVTVISYQAWERYFHKDPDVVGQKVTFYGTPVTVVGVLPVDVLLSGVDLWMPRGEVRNPNQLDRGSHPGFQVIGQLKRGVTLEQARVELSGIAAALEREFPATNMGFRVRMVPLLESMVIRVKTMLWILFGAVGFVLLIACANVTNLLLVRSIHREREFAIRAAIGASRFQSMVLVLVESLLVSAAGAGVGTLLAAWGVTALLKLQPGVLPSSRPVTIDPVVLAYAVLLMLVATLICGLAPAWRAGRGDLTGLLKQAARGSSARTQRLRAVLLTVEVALSIALLSGAGLMIRSLQALERRDPGFSARNLLTAQIMLPHRDGQTPASVAQASYACLDAIRSVPGVVSSAAVWPLPDSRDENWMPFVNFEDRPGNPGTESAVNAAVVTPGFFQTMGIPLLRGRVFGPADLDVAASNAAIVNQAYARKFYPGEDVIGKRVRMLGVVAVKGWKEIVGVVGDTLVGGMAGAVTPQIYWPYGQILSQEVGFVIRTPVPDTVNASVRRVVTGVDADVVFEHAQPMEQLLETSVADRRFDEMLLTVFAGLALGLASIGVYGLVAFSVAQRTRDIGIRIALGASAANVFRMVLAGTFVPIGTGLAVGLIVASALAPLLANQIYGITARDPVTFAGALAVLGVVALWAAVVPARRAVRIDPIVAMRQE